MSKFSEAAQAAGNLSRQYKSVLDLVAFVQELGDLDQAKEAAENALKVILQQKLKTEEAFSEANVMLNDANDALRGARVQAEQVTASADSYALSVRSSADQFAEEVARHCTAEQSVTSKNVVALQEATAALVSREAKLAEREAAVDAKAAKHQRHIERLKAAAQDEDHYGGGDSPSGAGGGG